MGGAEAGKMGGEDTGGAGCEHSEAMSTLAGRSEEEEGPKAARRLTTAAARTLERGAAERERRRKT